MSKKPSIPKGTRDFSPEKMVKRNYIFNTIRTIYQRYGFEPIETPAMENLSTLMGKYGEEGDKLLFKILNSGDYLAKADEEHLAEKNSLKLQSQISEKGLRYDLTVPFARFVVQNRNEITFPFKRYQIQPVWRADKPQKGRYREFYQCDADVIGSKSLLNEVELVQIIDDVFKALNINVIIKINNRKILAGIAEYIGYPDKLTDITVAIDKIDKIGIDNVNKELLVRGLSETAIEKLQPVLQLTGNTLEKSNRIKELLSDSEIGMKGIDEMDFMFKKCENLSLGAQLELDISLARGLNYYTGAIIEVKAADVKIGSICGGGRYDDLTGIFGLPDVSGVGISFGADRIYDVLEQLNGFPETVSQTTQILFINFGEKEVDWFLPHAKKLRDAGLNCEIYPDAAKMKKQMNFANKKGVALVALVGENEINSNSITIKNMETGEQNTVIVDEIVEFVKKKSEY